MMTAKEIIANYEMKENTAEGGYFAPVYTADLLLPANYATRRANQQLPICGSIYYLITQDNFSALHRVTSDMLYHFYVGDPVDVLLLDGIEDKYRRVVLGTDLTTEQQPSLVIPAGTWLGSRMQGEGAYALMGVSMAPAFDPENYEIGNRDALTARFPAMKSTIAKYTRP